MFDHHYSNCDAKFTPESLYKMASAGMVYKAFHGDVFELAYGFEKEKVGEEIYNFAVNKVYFEMFQPTDAGEFGNTIFCEYVPRTLDHVVRDFNRTKQEFELQKRQFQNAKSFVDQDLKFFD